MEKSSLKMSEISQATAEELERLHRFLPLEMFITLIEFDIWKRVREMRTKPDGSLCKMCKT
jgi:hypothetical protein